MYILLLGRGYPSHDNPQWGCFERDQAIALKKLGHKIVVISVDRRLHGGKRKVGFSYRNEDEIDVLNIYLFPLPLNVLSRCTMFIAKHLVDYLYNIVEKKYGKPDIIYSHYLYNSVLGLFLKLRYNIPLVCIEHWSGVNTPILPKYIRNMGKLVYPLADSVIAVSEKLKQSIETNFQNVECVVINNMVGGEFLECKSIPSKSVYDNEFVFVSVGSLVVGKGFDILILAFEKSLLKNENAKLVIVGDGILRNYLFCLIKERNLSDNVFIVGRKNKHELISILKCSNAFVLASKAETFGVSFVEAMMLGLPVISTSCGGPEDFINQDNGLLVAVDDIDGLSKALIYMYKNALNYNKNIIINEASRRFSPTIIASKLIELFNSVVRRKFDD